LFIPGIASLLASDAVVLALTSVTVELGEAELKIDCCLEHPPIKKTATITKVTKTRETFKCIAGCKLNQKG
jgi:hypothetical protein